MHLLKQLVKQVLISLIHAIRPLLAPFGMCRYALSCYDFGIIMLNERPLLEALWIITKRVVSCNPLWSFTHF